jgi:hypothetical protein
MGSESAGRPVFTFGSERDALFLRKRDAEQHKLIYKPKRWLVLNQDTSLLNQYGEPGDVATGTNGTTSVSATRQFTDPGATFITDGVKAGDLIEIYSTACDSDEDNGVYVIESVDSETQVTINQDWPEGENTPLGYRIESLTEKYNEFERPLPFLARLNPTEQELQRWGLQEKRDCLVVISIELWNQMGMYDPKIGDRFIYPYDVRFGIRNIHYEISELWPGDQIGDSMIAIHWLGAAKRTTNKLPASLDDCS